MKRECSKFNQEPLAIRSRFLAMLVASTCLVLTSSVAVAQKSNTPSPPEKKLEDFDRKNFDRSTNIDNKWLPLKPGTQLVYKGFTQDGKKRVPHRLVMTVTDLTKEIDGVRTVVMWDVDYKADKVVESELAFYAQDKDGNVWYFGELTETYEDSEWKGGRAWLGGTEGARAGIKMKSDPRPGTPSYSQGYSPPPYKWTDRGRVDQAGQKTCVPTGCYEGVVVIAESSEEEGPDAQQLKYHAPGVGVVRVGWRGKGEKLKETLELAEIIKLTPEALAKAREQALGLEQRAYIYGRTPPATPISSAATQ